MHANLRILTLTTSLVIDISIHDIIKYNTCRDSPYKLKLIFILYLQKISLDTSPPPLENYYMVIYSDCNVPYKKERL